MHRLCAVVAAALIVAPAAGAQTIRVAVRSLGDPSIARSLYPTVRELCPRAARAGPRRWRLTCSHARLVAEALGGRASGRRVVVETPFEWRRYPLYLRTVTVAGVRRFRSVNAGPARITVRRPGLTLQFVRMEPHAAAQAFRRGDVDAAPVALGDIKAALADPVVGRRVHVRPVRALERAAARASGLLAGAPVARAPLLREFRRRAAKLAPGRVRLAAGGDADLLYGASLLAAQWREVGLGPAVVRSAPDRFERLRAAYDAPEALFLALQRSPSPLLRQALAARDPLPFLRRLDARLRRDASVVPVAWVVSAWLVSPGLRGWRQDALGTVDYTRFAAK